MRITRQVHAKPVLERMAPLLDLPRWDDFLFPNDTLEELRDSGDLGSLIEAVKRSESALRDVRIALEELAASARTKHCPWCGEDVRGRSDRVFCSARCRQNEHRASRSPRAASPEV